MYKSKKSKKMLITLIIVISFLGLLILNKKVNIDRYSGIIKVSNVEIQTKKVKKNKTEKVDQKDKTISSFNTIRYKINYRLDSDKSIKRDAVITIRLSEEDKKYVVISEINNETVTSKTIPEGLELLVKNVETNYEHSLEIEVQINNAPNGYKFQPTVEVKEKTSDGVEIKPDIVEVKTTSLDGIVRNKDNIPVSNILVEVCLIDNDVCISKKQTYTDEDGRYVFSNLSKGVYKISVPEGYIVEKDTIDVSDGNNELNIIYDQNGRFSASIKKYVEKIKVGEKEYEIDKKQIVSIPMKGKNKVEASYLFEIENVSQSDGYIKTIRESLPNGFVISDDEVNKEWKKEGNYYINNSLSNEILKVGETKYIRIKIESEESVDAALYKNKVEILGESYHTVKYILNDQLYKEYEVADGDKIDNYKIEQEGYSFSGWCTDKSYKTKFDFDKTIGRDLILYGKLIDNTIPKRKIIYMEDDTTVFDTKYIDYGECAEDIEGPEKEGYTFNYWKKDGEKYFDGDICKPVIDEVTILYADFTANKYDVNYYIPGTKNELDNNYSYTNEYSLYEPFSGKIEYNTLINNPGKQDILYYNFRGWYKEKSLQNKITYPYRILKNEKFYGKYEIKKYNVEFYNSRTESEPFFTETIDATTLFDEPENTPPENHYIKEWQFEDGSVVTFGDIAYNILEDRVTSEDDVIKIYRVLEADKFKIRYLDYTNELIDENAEEILEFNQVPQKMDNYYNIVNAVDHREGYIFSGFSYKNKPITEYDITYYSDLCESHNNCVIDLVATYIDKSTLPVSVIFIDKLGTTTVETPRGQLFDQSKIPAFTGTAAPSKYNPTGWYKVAYENGEPIYNDGYQSTGELFSFDTEIINETTYVIADYTPNKYILRFNKNNDNNIQGEMANQELEFTPSKWTPAQGETPEALIDNISENQFTYPGSVFKGWKSDVTGNNIIEDQSAFNFLLFENDAHKVEGQNGTWILDLYPQFEELEYKIKYNANTGFGQMSDDTFTLSTAQGNTLKENEFTKTGYKFKGWSLESGDNKTIIYSDKESLENVISKMNELGVYTQTIYAQFEPINYTVTFKKEDDLVVGEMQDQNFVYDTPQNLNKNLYTKEGYIFKGWDYANTLYTDEQQVNNLTDVDGSVIELVTHFEIKKYKVIFMNQDSEYEVQNDKDYGSHIVPPVTNPTYNSGVFKGWKLNGENDLFDFDNRVINDDISEEINGERVIILVSVIKNIEPPVITTEPTEWTNDSVKITLSNDYNYDMKIKVGDSSYIDYTEPVYTSVNTEVRGKDLDGTDESIETIKQIDNIDKINPSISNYDSSSDSHNSQISFITSDGDSGINNIKLQVTIGSEDVTYCEYDTVKQNINERQTGPYSYNYSCSVGELTENTTYNGKIIVTDVAGNVKEENIEFSTTDVEDIVARIISYDNIDIENPDNYLNYSSLRAALNGCQSVSSMNKCTIQMVKSTTESNTVSSDLDIILDLNGNQITGTNSVTITNNGKLQIIDNNNTYENENLTSYEPIGKIINNHSTTVNEEIVYDGTAILNNSNATLIIGQNEVDDDEPGSIVSETEPYIEGSLRGIDASSDNSNLYFYDGIVKGSGSAIYGSVDRTPLLYDVNNVSSENSQEATLKILASAVARVKRTGTYFTNLDSARDTTNNGAYVSELVESEGDLINSVMPDQNYNYAMELTTTQKGILKDQTDNNYDAELYNGFIVNDDNSINFNAEAYAELPTIFENETTEETVQVKLVPVQASRDTIYSGTENEQIMMVIYSNYMYISYSSYKYALPADFYDGSMKTITVVKNNDNYDLYINNEKIEPANDTLSSSYAPTNTTKAYIGSGRYSEKSSMNFYELKIYDRALSQSELSANSNDGLVLNYDVTANNYMETEEINILRNNNPSIGRDSQKTKLAMSYIKIDLTNFEEDQKLVVSAALNRLTSNNYGAVAFVREESENFGPDYITPKSYISGEEGTFMNLKTRTERKDYETLLKCGKVYYLYFAYEASTLEVDNFEVYSVRLYARHRINPTPCILDEEIQVEGAQYGFEYNSLDGSLTSNNKGVNSSSALATFKIPNVNNDSNRTLTINATVSSESSDKALILVNTSATSLSGGTTLLNDGGGYNDYTYTNDYTTTLYANREYYIHFRYYKDSSRASGNDEFKINSIKIDGQDIMPTYTYSGNYSNLVFYEQVPKLNTEFDPEDERYKDADTIELLKDLIIDDTFNIEETRDVVLDIKGHSLTSSNSNDYLITNNGKLTITDSSYQKSLTDVINYNQEQQEQFNSSYSTQVEMIPDNFLKVKSSYSVISIDERPTVSNDSLNFDGGIYYTEKVVVGDYPITIDGIVMSSPLIIGNGKIRVGFSNTPYNDINDFVVYNDYTNLKQNEKTGKYFNVTISEPGEYYVKIMAQNYSDNDINCYLYSLNINDSPQSTNIPDLDSSISGKIMNSSHDGIINKPNAQLVVDNVIINNNKVGNYDNPSSAIVNYGSLSLKNNAIINANEQYSGAISNYGYSDIIDSSGYINIRKFGGIGVRNDGHSSEIEGITINMHGESDKGIENLSVEDLTVDNVTIKGSGTSINNSSTKNLIINNADFLSDSGITSTGNIIINSGTISANDVAINMTGAKLTINDGTVTSYTNSIVSTDDITINDGLVEGYVTAIKFETKQKANINILGGTIKSHNIGINMIEDSSNNIGHNGELSIKNATVETVDTSLYIGTANSIKEITNSTITSTNGYGIYYLKDGYKNRPEWYLIDYENKPKLTIDSSNIRTSKSSIKLDTDDEINIIGNTSIISDEKVIESTKGTINLGINDGNVSDEYPYLESTQETVYNYGEFNYYDGKLKGPRDKTLLNVKNTEENYDINVNEVSDNKEIVTLWIPTLNNDQSNAVAKIGETKFASLREAVETLGSDSKTIEVLKNIKTIIPLTIENGNTGIINLGNHDVKVYSKDSYITNNGNLEIKSNNGLLYSEYATLIENNGTATFESITMTGYENVNYVVENNGDITVNTGYLLTCNSDDCNLYEGNNNSNITFDTAYLNTGTGHAIKLNDNSEATINGGFYLGGFFATVSENSKLTINNADVTSSSIDNSGQIYINNTSIQNKYISSDFSRDNDFIKNNQSGYIEMNGGTIIPVANIPDSNRISVGIIIDYGDFVINSGTIKRTGIRVYGTMALKQGYIYDSSLSIDIYSSGEFTMGIKGDGVTSTSNPMVASYSMDYAPISVNTGGSFKFYDGIIKSPKATEIIPTEVEDGYSVKQEDDKNTNGDYTSYRYKKFLAKYNVAKIGDDEYVTLRDAINSEHCETAPCTIDLINDVHIGQNEEAMEVASNKNVTIRLNAKSIYSDNELVFNNLGTLYIKSTNSTLVNRTIINSNNLINNSGTATIELVYDFDKIKNSFMTNTGTLSLKNINFDNKKNTYNNENGIINLMGHISDSGIINNDNSKLYAIDDYLCDDGTIFLYDNSSAEVNTNNVSKLISGESENTSILVKNGTVPILTKGELIVNPLENKTPILNIKILEGGNADIYGGKITSIENSGTINLGVKDGTYNENQIEIGIARSIENKGIINYYDGTIKSNNILFSKLPEDIENGYNMLISSDDDYKYIMKLDNTGVAQIGSTTYNTVQDAIDSSYCQNSHCEIKLLKGLAFIGGSTPINIQAGKDIKLDLNGKMIHGANITVINNAGTLEIFDDDEAIILRDNSKIINNTGTLTINMNGYYSNTTLLSSDSIGIDNSGTMNITKLKMYLSRNVFGENISAGIGINNSGTLTAQKDFEIIDNYHYSSAGINSVLTSTTTLNECNIESNINSLDNSIMNVNGGNIYKFTNSDSSTLNINYGTIGSISNSGEANINQETDKVTSIGPVNNLNGGTMNVNGGTITANNKKSSAIINEGTLNVNGGNIRAEIVSGSSDISALKNENKGIVNISSGSFYAEYYTMIENSGTMHITGGDYLMNSDKTNTKIISNKDKGKLTIENTEINGAEYALELYDSTTTISGTSKIVGGISGIKFSSNVATLNVGDPLTPVSTTDPVIMGESSGVDNRTHATFNFYDGRVVGSTANSIFGDVSPLEGYQIEKNPGADAYEGYEVSTLTTSALIAKAVSLNGVNYSTLQEAFDNTVDNTINTMTLYVNINLEGNITVKDNTTVNIIKNGYEITKGNYGFVANDMNTVKIYYDGDESNSLLATIRELLNIEHPIKVRKNIVVYNDDNGNKLSSAEEYTLLYKNNGVYEEIDINENAAPGKYTISTSRSDDKIHSYNGYVTIVNIPEGEYKLSGDNGTVSTFIVNEDGTLLGNVRTTYMDDVYNANNLLASSEAKMILNIQTGKAIIRYEILISLIGVILTLFIVVRNKKSSEI